MNYLGCQAKDRIPSEYRMTNNIVPTRIRSRIIKMTGMRSSDHREEVYRVLGRFTG
jgi:hypothetical protein